MRLLRKEGPEQARFSVNIQESGVGTGTRENNRTGRAEEMRDRREAENKVFQG